LSRRGSMKPVEFSTFKVGDETKRRRGIEKIEKKY